MTLLNIPNRISELEEYLDAFQRLDIAPSGNLKASPDNSPLNSSCQLKSHEGFPRMGIEAVYDFIMAIRKDFEKYAGGKEGRMSRLQFERLVNDNRLPSNKDSEAYFQTHDRDQNGTLNLEEFTPFPDEICSDFDLNTISMAYVLGKPYPTGQKPTQNPVLNALGAIPSPPPLLIPYRVVEQRIRILARFIGGTTFRDTYGRLQVSDSNGKLVDIPAGIVPFQKSEAFEKLRAHAKQIGGTFIESNENGLPTLLDRFGNQVIDQIPEALRPPFLDSSTMPNATPPAPPDEQME
ncbi:MAG: hypothetical protein A2W80_16195 [Candidatus Riflebacteria bacterium GWC2_50_8]|nr:MAG: hypothetical protein A2W80_16195 [Candidatus Riflebacteria bacterium GWC2_50_8]